MARPLHAQQHTRRVALIGELADRAAITDLVHRLAAGLDDRRFAELRPLFAPDAQISTRAGTATGVDAIVSQIAGDHQAYARMQHKASNLLIEFEHEDAGLADADGEQRDAVRADLRLIMEGHFGLADSLEPVHSRGGVARAKVERTEDGWCFTALEITPTWSIGTPHAAGHGSAGHAAVCREPAGGAAPRHG